MNDTAEKARESANWLHQWERKAGARNARAMLLAYADLLEQRSNGVTLDICRKIANAVHTAQKTNDIDIVRAALIEVWPVTTAPCAIPGNVLGMYRSPNLMADKMTLQQVSDGLRTNADDLNRIDSMPMLADHLRNMADAIDAHIAGMGEPGAVDPPTCPICDRSVYVPGVPCSACGYSEEAAIATANEAVMRVQQRKLDEEHPSVNQIDEYAAGWRQAAIWANREDLLHDIGSPAYERDKANALQVRSPKEGCSHEN